MPKTAAGLIRSKEMMPKEPRAAKPVLHHIEVHPQMGGGVRVEHHFQGGSMYHEPKIKKFGAEAGESFADHMMKHSGMSWEPEEEGDKEANAGKENEIEDGDNVEQA